MGGSGLCGVMQQQILSYQRPPCHRLFGQSIVGVKTRKSKHTACAIHQAPPEHAAHHRWVKLRVVLKGGKKKQVFQNCSFSKKPCVAHMFNHGWWRSAVWWQLAVGGW